jgi:hypothetical protein
MKTYQITQDFGKGSKGYEYFDVEDDSTVEIIEKIALETQIKSYNNRMSGWFGKAKEKPTLKVKEYCNIKHKPLKNGIMIYIKWY